MPERIASFIPILDEALTYDINLGNHSVGSNVRDAACYVVWSFARAYSPEIMKPHVAVLSQKLIVESLFDREVNCRRAASATFQEAVGRQGNFPHGIEILTEADYFTLSNRVNAFLNVSCFVGQYSEYLEGMLNHLAFTQLRHWEPALRELSAQSLSVLSVFNPDLIIGKILPKLIELVFNNALNIRHGAILGVSELIIGLSGNSVDHRKQVLEKAFKTLSLKERNLIKEATENQKQFAQMYDELSSKNVLDKVMPTGSEIKSQVTQLVSQIEEKKLYKGKGGEIIRNALCHLIHAMCLSGLDLDEPTLHLFFTSLKENFRHPNQDIQESAAKAFKSMCSAFFDQEGELGADRKFLVQEI